MSKNRIKLDVITSTNDFLKELIKNQKLKNFFIVTAETQTHGKGQRGTVWSSEPGANLIMSIYIKNFLTDSSKLFDLNIIVSLSVAEVLEEFDKTEIKIKWPNDIMILGKKVGGILIENNFKSNGQIHSVVGIGLNVNQVSFDNLPKASSLTLLWGEIFEREFLLEKILEKIQFMIKSWPKNDKTFRDKYIQKIFKLGKPMPFSYTEKPNFMGIIKGVSDIGKLQILLQNNSVEEFDIKEIQMLY